MPFPIRKDITEKTCYVCRKWFWTDSLNAKYCSEWCHFVKFVVINDECWGWAGVKHTAGYGIFMHGRKKRNFAHRFSYKIFRGRIPKNMFVLHRCDNPICCKPSHLFLGTAKDNTADMIKKGRNRFIPQNGEKNGCAKLTEFQAKKIIASKEQVKTLAIRFNVAKSTIKAVRSGQNWKHLHHGKG